MVLSGLLMEENYISNWVSSVSIIAVAVAITAIVVTSVAGHTF